MKKKVDLTQGNILSILLSLAVPIILTNFIQTAYGMVDMIWIGRLGSESVAAIGTANFYVTMSLGISSLVIIGSGVKVAQSIGAKRNRDADEYIKNGIIMILALAISYALFLFVFRERLIGFFRMENQNVIDQSLSYLTVSAASATFMCLNSYLSTVFHSLGNSKVPFKVTSMFLVLNIVLDPIFIFGIGGIRGWGVAGAAVATLICRVGVTVVLLFEGKSYFDVFGKGLKFNSQKAGEVIKMGFPVTVQRISFTTINIFVARIVASFGPTAIAVQRVGVQIESISYMTIGGLQGAIAAFIGQNYGAREYERVRKGYYKALLVTTLFGGIVTLIFMIFPESIFKIFLKEKDALAVGISYLKIVGLSQAFMCMDLLTMGAFNGVGKTYVAPILSVLFTASRIPMAMLLSQPDVLGIDGIWVSISSSTIIKGSLLAILFLIYVNKYLVSKNHVKVGETVE